MFQDDITHHKRTTEPHDWSKANVAILEQDEDKENKTEEENRRMPSDQCCVYRPCKVRNK